MDREFMSNEENYCFDVAGYLIVRNALTSKKLDGLELTDLVAAAAAKRLCSAVFVSERDPEEAFVNSVWTETLPIMG
ncbi:MAG: hypothetical protein O7E52_17455, partial [Candidatus Poribacteria bacterium]|nr:hypothetical protein [Candidatus Poribacteria bacterium]